MNEFSTNPIRQTVNTGHDEVDAALEVLANAVANAQRISRSARERDMAAFDAAEQQVESYREWLRNVIRSIEANPTANTPENRSNIKTAVKAVNEASTRVKDARDTGDEAAAGEALRELERELGPAPVQQTATPQPPVEPVAPAPAPVEPAQPVTTTPAPAQPVTPKRGEPGWSPDWFTSPASVTSGPGSTGWGQDVMYMFKGLVGTDENHEGRIKDLETANGGHETRIKDLETANGGHETRIKDIEDKLNKRSWLDRLLRPADKPAQGHKPQQGDSGLI